MKTKKFLPLLFLLLFNVIGGAAQGTKADKPKRTVMLGQIVRDSFTGVKLKAHVTLMRQDSTVVDTINHQFRNLRDIQLHSLLASHGEEILLVGFLNVLEKVGQLLAEE